MHVIKSFEPKMVLDLIFKDKEILRYSLIMTSFFTLTELLYKKKKKILKK